MALTKISRGLLDTGVSDSSDATAITIDSNENIGIGTTSPSMKVNISHGDQDGLRFNCANDAETFIDFGDTDDDDVGRISYDHPSNFMAFRINASERMRISSTGGVGIGSTNPDAILHIQSSGATGALLNLETTHSGGIPIYNMKGAHSSQVRYQDENGNNQTRIDFHDAGRMDFVDAATGTALMKIHSSGCLAIGNTDDATNSFSRFGGSSSKYSILMNNNYGGGTAMFAGNTANSGWIFARFYTNGSQAGYLHVGTTTVGLVNSSDYRLKENVKYDFDALDRVKQLKPARFNFITDTETTVDGFLAHEVSDIVPEAIFGEKDAIDSEGNPEYQGIDQSKLVPLLTKAIQELSAKVEELESKVNE